VRGIRSDSEIRAYVPVQARSAGKQQSTLPTGMGRSVSAAVSPDSGVGALQWDPSGACPW